MRQRDRRAAVVVLLATALATVVAACDGTARPPHTRQPPAASDAPEEAAPTTTARATARSSGPAGVVTLAFAGDVHFAGHLAGLVDEPRASLGPMSRILRRADLAMVNLESAIASRGTPTPKELEKPESRYWFRTSPAALDLLDRSGVDVVSIGNNHGADHGRRGLRDTLRAARESAVAVVGVGSNRRSAFTPHRVSVNGTDVAVLAGDASRREGASRVWAAGPANAGVAAARAPRPRRLLAAVRRASRRDDLVIVYLHWGREYASCPTPKQRTTAQALAEAGADVVVGSHTHVPLGAGVLGDTYVSYGLGNFLWYHGARPDTGVLRLRVEDGVVVADDFLPGRIPPAGGPPVPRQGGDRALAVEDWHLQRGCTDLAPLGGPSAEARPRDLPEYSATVQRIDRALRRRMRHSHRPGCPVRLGELRYVRMSYVGFDSRHHTGEMVVHEDHARDLVAVFRRLYDARWPIRRMRLVDDYRGDDDRSMAANNTSAYNCRRVAGQDRWSDHAFGAAVDINPRQNPYLTGDTVAPPSGRRYARTDRSRSASVPPGVVHKGDVVDRAFARVGWEWGGDWATTPDYQHFSAGRSR